MKASLVLAAVLSFGIVGLAAGYGVSRLSREPEMASGAVSAPDLGPLEERLLAVEGRLAELPKLRAEVERLLAREVGPAVASLAPASAASERAAPEEEGVHAVQVEGETAPSKLETWLASAGMREDFDGLVARVYEQARDKRREREREEAEEQAREMKALSEGPYGKYNYRVNSLAKTLDLDTRQKDFLFNLLGKYDEKRKGAMESAGPLDASGATPQAIEERMQHAMRLHQQLQQQFESDLLLGLNPKQQEAYRNLGEHERGAGSWGDVKMFTFGGGGGKVLAPPGMPVEVELRQAFREVKTQLEKPQPEGR